MWRKYLSLHYGPHCCLNTVSGKTVIESHELYIRYDATQPHALSAINIQISQGQQCALIGTNGAGKSTLLRAIAGLLPCDKGILKVFEAPPGTCPHKVCYLPQRSHIDWTFPMHVERFVLSGCYVHLGWFRLPTPQYQKHLDRILRLLGLEHLRKRRIHELSGGQQQRILLARTLIHNADLLLLDEPLNAVDQETRHIIHETLELLKKEGKTVVMATHDIKDAAFDNIIGLHEGRQIKTASQDLPS